MLWVHKSIREGLTEMGKAEGKPASQVAIDILSFYVLGTKPVAKLAAKKIAKKSTAWDSKKTASQLKRQDVSDRIFQSGESTSSLAS